MPESPMSEPRPQRWERCRYCAQEIVLGKRGWRIDGVTMAAYECKAAPRGYHGPRTYDDA